MPTLQVHLWTIANFNSAQMTGSNFHDAFMIECNMQNITATSSDFTAAWLSFL